ncbi:MAG: PAS domain S-box protein [Solirubrobacteraceae bacterium]|nr:PAS domain S-box protein [Solirubrobacteraceae bacterium]
MADREGMTIEGEWMAAPVATDPELEQALLGLADGSYVLGTPDGVVAECGPGVVELLGASADELVGRPTAEVLVATADGADRRAFDDLMRAESVDVTAPRMFGAQSADGTARALRFVVIAVPLALGWEFTTLLGELGSRDALTWNGEALRARHAHALEAIEGVVRDGTQPEPGARLAGILIIVRDVDAPALTREDVDTRIAERREAARLAADEAARRADEAAGPYGDAAEPELSLDDLVERAHVLRERVEQAEHEAATAKDELARALVALAESEAERDAATARAADLQGDDERVAQLTSERDEARTRLETSHHELHLARAEADGARARAEAAVDELQRARADAQAAQAEASAARSEADAARSDAEEARSEVEAARSDAAAARSDVEAARSDAEAARSQAEVAHSEAEVARSDAEAARAAAQTAESAVDAAREDTASARADAERVRAELQATRDAVHQERVVHSETAEAELAGLRAEAEAAHIDAGALRAELGAAAAELEQTRAELGAAAAELEQTRTELETSLAAAEQARAEGEQARLRAQQLQSEADHARAAAEAIRAEFAFDSPPGGGSPGSSPAQQRTPWSAPARAAGNAPSPPAQQSGPSAEPKPEIPAVAPGQAAALIGLDGSFKRLDDAFCSLLGCREEDLRAARWPSIIDRENLDAHREIARRLQAGEIPSAEIETVYMHAQGLLVPIEGTITMHRADPGGPPTHFLFRADVSRTAGIA